MEIYQSCLVEATLSFCGTKGHSGGCDDPQLSGTEDKTTRVPVLYTKVGWQLLLSTVPDAQFSFFAHIICLLIIGVGLFSSNSIRMS
jgi:hypothetical protein